MASRIAGISTATIGGTVYDVVGKVEYSPGTIARTTVTGVDKVHGFKEMPRAPYISLTLRDAGNMTVADFNAMTDENVVLNLANGKLVTGSDMWTVDAQEVDTEEATFDVRFEGLSVVEA